MVWEQTSECVVFRSGWTQSPSLRVPQNYATPPPGTAMVSQAYKGRSGKRSLSLVTSRSIRQHDQLDDASDAESDVGSVSDAGSGTLGSSYKPGSLQVPLAGVSFFKKTLETGLGHEGWLAKSSSRNPRQWSRRYFVLRDGKLQSFMAPRHVDDAPLSVLHIGDVHSIRAQDASDATCRVFELEVVTLGATSLQQLRADSPEAMRRWLHVLEASCLVGSRPDSPSPSSTCCTARGSNDASEMAPSDAWETASASSSSLAEASEKTPMPCQGVVVPTSADVSQCESDEPSQWETLQTSSVDAAFDSASQKELLPLDLEELHKQLEAWLDTSPGEWHDRRKGDQVLQVLWVALRNSKNSPYAHSENVEDAGSGFASAIAAVKRYCICEGATAHMNAAIEATLAEFLGRLRQSLSTLLEDVSIPASEVEEISCWWLLDARPTIEEFERGVAEAGFQVVAWRGLANSMEHALLSEWEVRCCEELSAACEAACRSTQTGHDDGTQAMLIPLRVAVQQIEKWNSRQPVRDRAVSVLIAAMNAALRALRRRLTGVPQDGGGRASHWASTLQRWATGKVDGTVSSITSEVCSVACSATAIAKFCGENVDCVDVMSTFSSAFDHLCQEACASLVEIIFVSCHQSALRIRFRKRELRKANGAPGGNPVLLGPSLAAAEGFLSNLAGPPAFVEACKDHVVVCIIRALVRAWFLGLAQAPPAKLKSSGSSGLLCNAASLDAAALRNLIRRVKATDHEFGEYTNDPVVALDILVETLGHQSSLNPGRLHIAIQQFRALLGPDIAKAVELSLHAAFVV